MEGAAMNEHLPWVEQIRTIRQNFTALPGRSCCPGATLLLEKQIADANARALLAEQGVECPICRAAIGQNCKPDRGPIWNHPERTSSYYSGRGAYA